ncbi:MAG: 50S ribosomal protein L18 [Candidatus Saccharimonadales bacterium]
MDRLAQKVNSMQMRKRRVRATISGTKQRPRLSVHISLNHVNAQLIDDTNTSTIVYVTSIGRKLSGTMTDKASAVGSELAKKAKTAGVNKVVFDRGSKLYHGRIKAFADAAREGGLEF